MDSARTTVISVGTNTELVRLRHFVLQEAGFNVVSTFDEHDALSRIERGECGVLVMCYSLGKSIRQRLSEALRRFCPESRIIAITNEHMDKPDFADTFVYGVEGPEALIEVISAAVESSRRPGERTNRHDRSR
jgi:DNA-binding NarL/FixJ family response regulator